MFNLIVGAVLGALLYVLQWRGGLGAVLLLACALVEVSGVCVELLRERGQR